MKNDKKIFRIKPADSFNFRATLHVPGDGDIEVGLTAQHYDADTLQEKLKAAGDDAAFARETIIGWERADFDADWSAETFAAVLQAYPGLAGQIVMAYLAELQGGPQAKNSLMRLATGR